MSTSNYSRSYSGNETTSIDSAATMQESSSLTTTSKELTSIFSRDLENTTANITDSLLTSMTTTDISSLQIVTKDMINKKQLQHDLELARIELNQKNLMIDSMKAEYLSKIDELEEKASDAIHQKQLMAAQFQHQLRVSREVLKKENEQLKNEVASLLKEQKGMNQNNEKLMEKAMGSKEVLENLEIDEAEYHNIKGKTIEEQSLWEFIAVSFCV